MRYTEKWYRSHAARGAALADQVAEYFIAFPPQYREEQIAIWLQTMRILMLVNEERQADNTEIRL